MHLILPVAGNGSRFSAAGYTQPKPLIDIAGRPMLAWALDPIPHDWTVHLVGRNSESFMQVVWGVPKDRKEQVRTVVLPGPTEGGACTVLAAALGLPPDEPVAVMNADQVFKPSQPLDTLRDTADASGCDGIVLTFTPAMEGDARWSYVATDEAGIVTRVVEKQAISPHATIGFYWFRRARDLVWAICHMVAVNDRTNGEFYLCPAYQHLVDIGARIVAVPVPWFRGLGTPEDVRSFEEAQRT